MSKLTDIDDYLDKLYDLDVAEKVKGSYMIMQLARQKENLEHLIENETLLGALSRVLKEEFKVSMDLVINILYVFYSFSHFSYFHEVIETYEVGQIVLRTIEYEEKRYRELRRLKRSEKTEKILVKQEKLLFVCFHILLNLAEDLNSEFEMKKHRLIEHLVSLLDRSSPELLILAVTFLKKLSVVKENINEISDKKVVKKILKFLPHQNEGLVNETLRLLLNLSFDPSAKQLIGTSCLPTLISQMQNPKHHEVAVKLLYQVSQDEKINSNFQFTDCIPILIDYISDYPKQYVSKELMALAINLSTNQGNAERIASGQGLKKLIERLSKKKDSLVAKMIRNVSQHETVKPKFALFSSTIVNLAIRAKKSELLVELLGIIGNFTSSHFNFDEYFSPKYNFQNFLLNHLNPHQNEDDIVLESIICVGAALNSDKIAYIVAETRIAQVICDLFQDKQNDDEIVLQTVYVLYKFLSYQDTRTVTLQHKEVVQLLVSLLQDENTKIKEMADKCVDLVMFFDPRWKEELKKRKFELYNEHWVNEMKSSGELDDSYQSDEQNELDNSRNEVGNGVSKW